MSPVKCIAKNKLIKTARERRSDRFICADFTGEQQWYHLGFIKPSRTTDFQFLKCPAGGTEEARWIPVRMWKRCTWDIIYIFFNKDQTNRLKITTRENQEGGSDATLDASCRKTPERTKEEEKEMVEKEKDKKMKEEEKTKKEAKKEKEEEEGRHRSISTITPNTEGCYTTLFYPAP